MAKRLRASRRAYLVIDATLIDDRIPALAAPAPVKLGNLLRDKCVHQFLVPNEKAVFNGMEYLQDKAVEIAHSSLARGL
jgi:hypothetical protein